MIYFTWLHQEHPFMRALVKLMHGQLKGFVSLNLRKSVFLEWFVLSSQITCIFLTIFQLLEYLAPTLA